MYSLSGGIKPLRPFDAWFGAHQRLDRMAIRQLQAYTPDELQHTFPTLRQIVQFEGVNGPDGIKLKTPAQGEPWHYYNPYDSDDTQILDIIRSNYKQLVKALKEGNKTRAAFEAAWLAHGIVDGLTPAHHYPYEEELNRLRGGAGIETRTSYKDKLLMPGDTMRERLKHNWEMMGDKGLLSTHMAFEFGVAVLIVPMRLKRHQSLNAAELNLAAKRDGYIKYFQKKAREIADMKLYEAFYASGWTPRTANLVRRRLAPAIVDALTFAWYSALQEANK